MPSADPPSWLASFGRARTGGEALASWLRRRAKLAGHMIAVEEALLTGRFWRYALRRLSAFTLARFWGTALHVLELTWLAEVFSAKPFVASLALQNATLVIDAGFFGALESLRRRARELGPGSDASALTTRWLTIALWLGIAVTVLPAGRALVGWGGTGRAPSLLHLYALVCGLRLGADVVLRTYYSGVFAFQRVYRPMWMPLVTPAVLVGGTIALWERFAGYAFVLALAASVIVSRALLYVYTRRAYRLRRIPLPRFRLAPRLRGIDLRHLRDAVLAGAANTTTRIGGVVLIAAVIPSLRKADLFDDASPAEVEPFAFALHLAAPLLFLASQWWLVFYHDWKRLEGEAAASLARQLHRRLLVTAALIGVGAWAAASALVLFYVPLGETWETLLALAPAMIGLSIWTALQLRGFARGEFVRQVASAGAMLLALWVTISAEWLGTASWYVALGAAPWIAIALATLLGRIRTAHATGEVETLSTWVRAMLAAKGDVAVWVARVGLRPARVTARIASELGDRGAIVQAGARVIWFERAPFTPRSTWLACGGGTIVRLEARAPAPAEAQREALETAGLLRRPDTEEGALSALARVHARLFPEGFVVHVGRAPPPGFLALPPVTRQAIWRDAVRVQRGARSRSGWFVTTYAPEGAAEVLYVTKRPVPSKQAAEWHATLGRLAWKIFATEG